MLGYLDLTPRSTTVDEAVTYLPHATAMATTTSVDDGFAIPASRAPRKQLSKLLTKGNEEEEDSNDGDDYDYDVPFA